MAHLPMGKRLLCAGVKVAMRLARVKISAYNVRIDVRMPQQGIEISDLLRMQVETFVTYSFAGFSARTLANQDIFRQSTIGKTD